MTAEAALRYRMVYLVAHDPNRPHTLPLMAPSAEQATRMAETIAAIPGWTLLTVKAESRWVDRSPLARAKRLSLEAQ